MTFHVKKYAARNIAKERIYLLIDHARKEAIHDETLANDQAQLAKKTGMPVKMMLERDHELLSLGSRPSAFARIKMAAQKDGELVAWESEHWGTQGAGQAGTINEGVVPYVFRQIPNSRTKLTGIQTNTGPQKAWRAPNHPQGAALSMAALADMAAALYMDEIEFFKKNLG